MPARSEEPSPPVVNARSLRAVRERARDCRACELWERGTQTVFGEGPARATMMLVGEQPGDREDRAGVPFVGPAGALLDRALTEAGVARDEVYVTNVVKHFNWEPRGKRRIHQKPRQSHIVACRPWLDAEIALVRPEAIVCLGATAAQTLLGSSFKVTTGRGTPVASPLARVVLATVHPSSILRITDEKARAAAFDAFVADLAVAARALGRG